MIPGSGPAAQARRLLPGLRLPRRVKALVNAGIVTEDRQVRRRQRFTNIASYALGLDALTHLVVNAMHDFEAMLPVNVYNLAAVVAYFLMHRLHRLGENAMANVLIAFSLVGHSYVVLSFGLDSSLHVYFTLAGVILFFVGIAHWKNFLALFALSLAALLFLLNFASDNGWIATSEAFRDSLATQAMVSAAVLNAVVIAFALSALAEAEQGLKRQFERTDFLLGSILPRPIAARLKTGRESRIADRLEGATVLFVDLVGFTPAAAKASPEEVVDYLHRLFSRFDALCDAHGVDKIKTIGDSYMAVGGLHGQGDTAADAVGSLALAIREAVRGETLAGVSMQVRAGIHHGPLVAGVIGDRRLAYDVWGDTVNVAARLESTGAAGRIHVSDAYRRATRGRFRFEPRGMVNLKGAGPYSTHFLEADGNGSSGGVSGVPS